MGFGGGLGRVGFAVVANFGRGGDLVECEGGLVERGGCKSSGLVRISVVPHGLGGLAFGSGVCSGLSVRL